MRKSGQDRPVVRALTTGLWAAAAALVVGLGYRYVLTPPPEPGRETFPTLQSTDVVAAPTGHAYRFVAAPGLTWDQARAAAEKRTYRGRRGYLATLDDQAEFQFVLQKVFSGSYVDVTYLGGRQTAPHEWRWVTGPDAAADGGRGALFWTGDERGAAVDGHYGEWMQSAFQHGGRWDVNKVCCVTLFSYGIPKFSTSLGDGFREEGVAGYLVEFGD